MQPKLWYQSKILWASIMSIAIFAIQRAVPTLPPEFAAIGMALLALVTAINRTFFTQGAPLVGTLPQE